MLQRKISVSLIPASILQNHLLSEVKDALVKRFVNSSDRHAGMPAHVQLELVNWSGYLTEP